MQSTIHLHQTTTSTPDQYVAGLTDFGPGRSKLFRNSADEHLKLHSRGPTQAGVTEGSGGIWERLHADIDVVFVREGKDLKVWLLGLVAGTIGKGVLEKAFKNSVTAIEARNAFPTACRCG